MKVSFLILGHKSSSQIIDFINTLDCKDVTFFIHIDKKSKIMNDSSLEKIKSKENVKFIDQRQQISWGGYGMISATLILLKECLKKEKCDYISLHSGQDLPIKNRNQILYFLEKNQGKEYFEFFKIKDKKRWAPNTGFDRIEYYWFIEEIGYDKSMELYKAQKKLNVKRKYFKNIEPYGGSQWWTITRECAQFIIDYVNQNKDFCDYYKYTMIPDEGFFQTIVLNSYFKDRVINDNLRYIDWESGPEYPKILKKQDFKRIATSNKLFARKFDSTVDKTIIKMITNSI